MQNKKKQINKQTNNQQTVQSPTLLQVELDRLRLQRAKNIPALGTHRFQPTSLHGSEPCKQLDEKPIT